MLLNTTLENCSWAITHDHQPEYFQSWMEAAKAGHFSPLEETYLVARSKTELVEHLTAFCSAMGRIGVQVTPQGDMKVACTGDFPRRTLTVVSDLPEGIWVPAGHSTAYLSSIFGTGLPLVFQRLQVSWAQ